MGEMAEYYADLAMQQQAEFDEDVADVLKNSDDYLFLETSLSDSVLIKDIRDYYTRYKKLSEKQKYCLARWIVENE
jgi:sulfur relay (sulfurtransferase) DsrC/TusE family protein